MWHMHQAAILINSEKDQADQSSRTREALPPAKANSAIPELCEINSMTSAFADEDLICGW